MQSEEKSILKSRNAEALLTGKPLLSQNVAEKSCHGLPHVESALVLGSQRTAVPVRAEFGILACRKLIGQANQVPLQSVERRGGGTACLCRRGNFFSIGLLVTLFDNSAVHIG